MHLTTVRARVRSAHCAGISSPLPRRGTRNSHRFNGLEALTARHRGQAEVEGDVRRPARDEHHRRGDRMHAVEGGTMAAFPALELKIPPRDDPPGRGEVGATAL